MSKTNGMWQSAMENALDKYIQGDITKGAVEKELARLGLDGWDANEAIAVAEESRAK